MRKKKLIGYNDIVAFLTKDHHKSREDTIETICAKTRQYAKRQRTFWRKLEREIKHQNMRDGIAIGCIEQLDLTNLNLQLYINELSKRLFLRVKK